MFLVLEINEAGGGTYVIDLVPYKENGLLDFVVGLDYGHDYTLTFNREWDKIFNDYMNKEY